MSTGIKAQHQIKVTTINEVQIVNKPWGWEKWIADGGSASPYVLKEIYIKASCKTSLQFHKFKRETSYVQKGRGLLHYSELPIDADKFINGIYTKSEIQTFVSSVKTKELIPGSVFHVFPGLIHRVEAIEDLLIIESSTVEVEDVLRLQDDTNRSHGRIESEHS